jgi:hypothetical protein
MAIDTFVSIVTRFTLENEHGQPCHDNFSHLVGAPLPVVGDAAQQIIEIWVMPPEYYYHIDNQMFSIECSKPFPAFDISFCALIKKKKKIIFGLKIILSNHRLSVY